MLARSTLRTAPAASTALLPAGKRLTKFAGDLGAKVQLEIKRTSYRDNPQWSHLTSVDGDRQPGMSQGHLSISQTHELRCIGKTQTIVAKTNWAISARPPAAFTDCSAKINGNAAGNISAPLSYPFACLDVRI